MEEQRFQPVSEMNRTTTEQCIAKKLNLSDAGKYAYAAMCSVILGDLFPSSWNKDFNHHYIDVLCQHLNINKKTKEVMVLLAEGKTGHTVDPYISLLLEEENIKGKTILIVQDLVLLAVHEGFMSGEYDARQRVLIRQVSNLLNVPFDLVELYEQSLVKLLSDDINTQTESEQEESSRRDKIRKIKRYASIGAATIAGGTLIGLTGGLAAPFIGVGLGAVLGSATAAAVSTTAGVAIIGSIFGVAGAGLTGYKMNKRVGEVEEFSFESLSNQNINEQQQLHIGIVITGWITDENHDNVVRPWHSIDISKEQYSLKYETKYLLELGKALDYILSIAVSVATQEALKYTILSSLVAAVAWPTALLSISSVIDNPWSVCCRRSSEVGKHLAHILRMRQHGKRPVTLVGFSLGARVIFYCLRELSDFGGGEGIIQDAILLGAPVTNRKSQWEKCSRAVAGRLVNGYSRGDWLLKFLYRTLSMTTGVAGLLPVDCANVTNIDLSSVVSGHREYSDKLSEVLKFVDVKTKEVCIINAEGSLQSVSENQSPTLGIQNNIDGNMKTSKSDLCLPNAST